MDGSVSPASFETIIFSSNTASEEGVQRTSIVNRDDEQSTPSFKFQEEMMKLFAKYDAENKDKIALLENEKKTLQDENTALKEEVRESKVAVLQVTKRLDKLESNCLQFEEFSKTVSGRITAKDDQITLLTMEKAKLQQELDNSNKTQEVLKKKVEGLTIAVKQVAAAHRSQHRQGRNMLLCFEQTRSNSNSRGSMSDENSIPAESTNSLQSSLSNKRQKTSNTVTLN